MNSSQTYKNLKERNKEKATTTTPWPNRSKQSKKVSWITLWKVAPEQISALVNLVLSLLEKYQFN